MTQHTLSHALNILRSTYHQLSSLKEKEGIDLSGFSDPITAVIETMLAEALFPVDGSGRDNFFERLSEFIDSDQYAEDFLTSLKKDV